MKKQKELVAKWQQMQEERKKIQRFNNAASIIAGYVGATLSFLSIGVAYEYAPTFLGVDMFWPATVVLVACGIFFIGIPIAETNSSLQ